MSFRTDRLATLYFFHPLRRLAGARRTGIPILMYHSISEQGNARLRPYYETATAPRTFAQQVKFLYQNNYVAVGLRDAAALAAGEEARHNGCAVAASENFSRTKSLASMRAPGCHWRSVMASDCGDESGRRKPVVITFDDGFEDFYSQAFPILDRYGYRATMFLPTGFIGDSPRTFKGACYLTWSRVRELHDAGIHFGSHTVNHPKLTGVSPSQMEDEVRQSKLTIEDKLGCAVNSFAYPYAFPATNSSFRRSLRRVLEDAGYTDGVSTMVGTAGAGDDVFFMKRLPVNSCDDLSLLRAKLEGGYDWTYAPQYLWKKLSLEAKAQRIMA